MFQVHSWPNVIVHLDGDSFFASVHQAVNPSLKNKPLVTGQERGVVTSVSFQAKQMGIKRTTPIYQIKKYYPTCIVVDSDYELYSLFSHKMFDILNKFSPLVEEYSIDEAFADIKGLRRPLNLSYIGIGKAIKNTIENSLGITVSVGISLTKSLAKLASSCNRPSGLTAVNGLQIDDLLRGKKIEDVWGIGENTSAYLKKFGIKTALDFVLKPEEFIKKNLSKPFLEIWQELRGEKIYEVNPNRKSTYQSITRSQTLSSPTNNSDLLWAELLAHVEEAFETARRFNYRVGRLNLFLKTQQFAYHQSEIKFIKKISYPFLIRDEIRQCFQKIYKKGVLYRTTGCTLSDLSEEKTVQESLFVEENMKEEKAKKIYPLYEARKINFGTALYEEKQIKEKKQSTKIELPVINI